MVSHQYKMQRVAKVQHCEWFDWNGFMIGYMLNSVLIAHKVDLVAHKKFIIADEHVNHFITSAEQKEPIFFIILIPMKHFPRGC